MKNILFVSHDANRAGAQILLLRFLKLLKNHPDFKFSILLKEGGIIEKEFEELATTYYWTEGETINFIQKVKNKISGKKLIEKEGVFGKLMEQDFDLIVSNTVTNGRLLDFLYILAIPIITYVHELEIGIQQYTSSKDFQTTLEITNSYIACAESVKENLIKNHAIDATKIKVLPSLLPESALSFESSMIKISALKKQYDIPENAFLIGGIGTVDLRKGVDVFLQVAHQLKQEKDIYFLWVGGQNTEIDYKIFQIDKDRLELKNVVFQTSVDNPLDFMDAFDVFFVSSREDPYPLVVLEAAVLSKPIICFDKAGGAKDFVENDCGFVVDYLDIRTVKERIIELKEKPLLKIELGENARKKALERHNQETAFQTFIEILNTSI
ncbi:MAG: glycosyltransferase family 4 protein [Arcicella sp.]|nr:glycosyltransferase family 4 protein [Arcicella sp.]